MRRRRIDPGVLLEWCRAAPEDDPNASLMRGFLQEDSRSTAGIFWAKTPNTTAYRQLQCIYLHFKAGHALASLHQQQRSKTFGIPRPSRIVKVRAVRTPAYCKVVWRGQSDLERRDMLNWARRADPRNGERKLLEVILGESHFLTHAELCQTLGVSPKTLCRQLSSSRQRYQGGDAPLDHANANRIYRRAALLLPQESP